MVATEAYSGTPLPRKLGLKQGQVVAFVNLPDSLQGLTIAEEFAHLERQETWQAIKGKGYDFIHLFTDNAATVRAALPALRSRIKVAGMIWVSWPKKSSHVPSDVTEDVIRSAALADILVDVKVCAVDRIWSGLKLVIRKELRDGPV